VHGVDYVIRYIRVHEGLSAVVVAGSWLLELVAGADSSFLHLTIITSRFKLHILNRGTAEVTLKAHSPHPSS